MSTFTRQAILFAISFIDYVMRWEPAPVGQDVVAKVDELRSSLAASAGSLVQSTDNATKGESA